MKVLGSILGTMCLHAHMYTHTHKLYANNFENLDQIDNFLIKPKFSKLPFKELENLNLKCSWKIF